MNDIPMIDLKKQYLSIKNEIDQTVAKVLNSGKFILDEQVQQFEKEMASFCETEYAIAVHSGTDALYLSLLAADVRPGDQVITTAFSFVATVEPIRLLGAVPVFADIDKKTYNIDVTELSSKITKKTKAIIPVHIYGHPAEMDPIMEIAKSRHLKVIEDAAQAIGAIYKKRKAGTIGDLGCLSFYPTKNLGAYGDGGMVLTNNKNFANKIKMLRDHGTTKKYYHTTIGINSRLDELQAAILRVKLKHLDSWIKKRRANAMQYNTLLKDAPIVCPYESSYVSHVYHQYTIRCKNRKKFTIH